jgi:organic radical activating enzyme
VRKGYLSELFISFQGEGLFAGRKQLFLRLSGCHLRCRYCDTPGSLERSATYLVYAHDQPVFEGANPLTVEEVRSQAARVLAAAGGADGLAVTGGEPLLQADFLAELLDDDLWPRPRMLETSGTQPDKLSVVLPFVDAVSMDIKLPSNTGEPPFWDTHAQFLAAAGNKAYVKILVDDTTLLEDVERAADVVSRTAPAASVFLQPITAPTGRCEIQPGTLPRFFAVVREQLADVRVLPQTHKMLGIQ